MHNFSNGPSLMQSYSKVPCITSQCIYTCITYGTVPCVTLQKIFSSCTVSAYTRYNKIVSWRSVQAFTNDPLPIQIRQEYFIEIVKYKLQGGWFIQFKIQYQLRIKGPKTKCIKTDFCSCWPLTVEHSSFIYQEYPECSGFQAGSKDQRSY